MKELKKNEKKFLEDLVRYSNEVFGKGSRKALTEGAPVTYEDVRKKFKRVLGEEKEYGKAIEDLIEKNILKEEKREKEVHRRKEGRNVREMQEWEYLVVKESEVLEQLETEPEGEKP